LRFLIHLLAMIAVALGTGFGLSWYALNDGRLFGALEVGPWAAWSAIGSPAPDPYTRAYLARAGALQLGQSEGLQFVATADSDGRALERNCRYRIDGTTPVATFWTLVAIDAGGVNIARSGAPLAMQSARIARADDGSIILYVSKSLAPENWLEITGDGPFSLALTLYDTQIFSGVGQNVATLPAITREACT
jgi:hypothetical protein